MGEKGQFNQFGLVLGSINTLKEICQRMTSRLKECFPVSWYRGLKGTVLFATVNTWIPCSVRPENFHPYVWGQCMGAVWHYCEVQEGISAAATLSDVSGSNVHFDHLKQNLKLHTFFQSAPHLKRCDGVSVTLLCGQVNISNPSNVCIWSLRNNTPFCALCS